MPAVFHCCYFYLHTQLFSRCASSFKDSNATAAAATIINNVIIINVSVIIIGSNNNVCIVDINGTNRRPASLHKRKCRVVSVSLAGSGGKGKRASRRQGISATDEQTTTIATGECDSGHGGRKTEEREQAAVLHSGRKAFNRQQHIRF